MTFTQYGLMFFLKICAGTVVLYLVFGAGELHQRDTQAGIGDHVVTTYLAMVLAVLCLLFIAWGR